MENAREQVKNGVIQRCPEQRHVSGPNQQPPDSPAHVESILRPGLDHLQGNISDLSRAGNLLPGRHRHAPEDEGAEFRRCRLRQDGALEVNPPTRCATRCAGPANATALDHHQESVDADLLNLVFLGSREQVQAAFREAGWHNSDPVSKHSFLRKFLCPAE